MKQDSTIKDTFRKVWPHVAVWGIIYILPYATMMRSGFSFSFMVYNIWFVPAELFIALMFYGNYFLLVPKLLFANRTAAFVLTNFFGALSLALLRGICIFMVWLYLPFYDGRFVYNGIPLDRPMITLGGLIADMMPFIMMAFVATFIRMNARWRMLETLQKESAKQLAEAEVQNMRNQLSPHFLLNTLNNIYALIAFDTDKAQNTVQELSKLLRHVLYDNQQPTTTLSKEVDFIRSYIELMRIRLSGNVRLTTEFNVKKDSQTEISPLIFISLIENAFKHGISPTEPSFISITLSEEDDTIKCVIVNSNFPKSAKDKSGSGIGLQQVQRRLDLGYPDKYEWEKGTSADGKEYYSRITLHTD